MDRWLYRLGMAINWGGWILMAVWWLILLLVALAFLGVGTAHAATPAQVASVARTPWKASHCYGREVVTFRAAADMPVPGEDGHAIIGDPACAVSIRAGMTDLETCDTEMHEFGHLAGLGHSANPRSIMYWRGASSLRCLRAFAGWA